MGAGRRTQMLSMGERVPHTPSANASVSARNLRINDLGAVIFGCKKFTKDWCLQNQLFGLPRVHISYVKNIRPGLPLFLFNYTDRKLRGIFEAASNGKLDIDPYGWTDGTEKTPFSAQVRIRMRKECRPLSEEQFYPILIDNYYGESNHFWFELDHAQTGALLALFESMPVPSALTYNPPASVVIHQAPYDKDRKDGGEGFNHNVKSASSDTASKWSSLFKDWPNGDSTKRDGKENSITSKPDCSQYNNGDMGEWNSLPMPAALTYNAPTQGNVHQVYDTAWGGDEEASKSTQNSTFSDNASKWSSLFKEKPNDDLWNHDQKLKSITSETDCTRLVHGETCEWYSSTVSERDEENEETQILESHSGKEETQILENHSGKEEKKNEEERIYSKLKQIAINKGILNASPKDHMEEAFDPCTKGEEHLEDEYSSEELSIQEKCDMNESFVPCKADETHLEDEHFLEASPVPKECEDGPTDSSNIHSVINKLHSEVKNLKALYMDELKKTCALEKKRACVDAELQQLRDHVKLLASQLKNSSNAYVCDPMESSGSETMTEPLHEPQLGMKELIFIMGGCNGDNSWLSTVECYSPSNDIVQYLKPMSTTRSYSSATLLNGYIFNIGGCGDPSGSSFFDTVECYDPLNNDWIPCPPISEKKGCLATATVHNKIYAIGGGGGGSCSSKVEMFDPALGRWSFIPSMLQKRFTTAAAELNGVIYVVGGYDGNYLNSAERYDPREASWCKLQNMNIRRGSHSLAVLNEQLYVLGGFEELGKMLPSVEVFDPRIGSWVMDDEMKQPRGHCFAPVIGKKIYAIGGMKGRGVFADTVECYTKGRGWSVTNLKGLGKRSFFSATLL